MPETLSIPGYTIERKLGQGGMASVYLAIQESFGRAVALKVMSPELSADPSFATRFMREARIVAVLSHASIVPVFEVGEHGSVYYLSMEYLPAGDLKDRIQHGECNVALAIDVCTAVCSALDVAHRKGFVHRDIKPENIMFREDGTPVVTDFGIARAVDNGNSLTMAGMMVGTPAYMSPEQVRGQELDGRSDLYSVGVVFYEILTGGLPFEADSSLSVALKHLSDRLPPLPPDLAEYQEFFERLTAKNRESRFASGADVVRALRSLAPVREAEGNTLVRPRFTQPLNTDPMMPAAPQAAAQAFVPEKPAEKKPPLQFPKPKPNEAARAVYPKSDKPAPQPRPPVSPVAVALGPRNPAHAAPHAAPHAPAPGGPKTATGTEVLQRRAPGLIGEVRTALRRDGPHRNSVSWVAAGALTAAATVGVWMLLMNGSGPSQGAAAQQPPQVVMSQQTSSSSVLAAQDSRPQELPVRSDAASSSAFTVSQSAQRTDTPAAPDSSETASSSAEPVAPAPAPPPARAERPEPRFAAVAPPPPPNRTVRPEERNQRIQHQAQLMSQQAAAARVRELLTNARVSVVTGALLAPTGNSARDQYLAILQLRPKQPEALAGVSRLAGVLLDEASRYETFGDIYNASYMLNQVRMLQPSNQRLGPLQDKLSQLQAKPIKLDQRDKAHLEKVDQFVSRAHQRLKILPFDAHAVGDATELYDGAMAEEPNAPGLPMLRNQLVAAYPSAVQTERSMRDFHSAEMLMDAARKHGWLTAELERADKSTLPPLPKMDGKGAPKPENKPLPAKTGSP